VWPDWHNIAMVGLVLLALAAQAAEPDASNYREWLEFIQPDAQEQAYKEIDWRNRLADAIPEARELGRPILLWTMNGHPLGCT
jgi:hypothetical protein